MKVPRENLDYLIVDLSDLNSVEKFSKELLEKYPQIDALVCNAGRMALEKREETVQGHEMQMGVNCVGHFALACQVLPALEAARAAGRGQPRLVFLSSVLHKSTNGIDFSDFDSKRNYDPWQPYYNSKLGMLYMMSKFAELYPKFIVAACHPGISATSIQDGTSAETSRNFAQKALMGALPTVMAVTDPGVTSKEYLGPYWSMYGTPARAGMTAKAQDTKDRDRFITVLEQKTGVTPPSLDQ